MATTTHPDKEQVRAWMAHRQEQPAPPPAPEEIRRQLGWWLVQDKAQSTEMGR
jgi:hypothetical protein